MKLIIEYKRIEGRLVVAENMIPMEHYIEFLDFSNPTFRSEVGRPFAYHSLARTRRFLNKKGLEYITSERK